MDKTQDLLKNIDALINQGQKVLGSEVVSDHSQATVNEEAFHEFRIASLSFLSRVFGRNHSCYQSYYSEVTHATSNRTKRGLAALKAGRKELEGDWLETTKGQLTKAVLVALLRQARGFCDQGQLNAALVVAGTVVTEALRHQCSLAEIPLHNTIQGKAVAKGGLQLSGEAYKKKILTRPEKKELNDWLELAAKAAEKEAIEPSPHKVGKTLGSIQSWLAGITL